MIIKYLLAILLISFNMAQAKETKEVFFGTSAETLNIPFGENTILHFEKRIKRYSKSRSYIIGAEDEANPDYTTLRIAPKFTSGTERVSFYLEDGKIARVKFVTVKNDEKSFKELTYSLRSKSFMNRGKSPVISEIELMKAMIKGEHVNGFKNKRVSQYVRSGRKGVTSRLLRIYQGQYINGYVFKLSNKLRKHKVKINLKDFKLGSPDMAILSQSDEAYLYPKGKGVNSTLVRVVTKPILNSSNIRLPMISEKLKK